MARSVIEAGLAEMAAESFSDEKIKQLEDCLERSSHLIDDATAFMRVDIELNKIIHGGAENAVLFWLMNAIVKLSYHGRACTGQIYEIRC